jgi:hypothetical protein
MSVGLPPYLYNTFGIIKSQVSGFKLDRSIRSLGTDHVKGPRSADRLRKIQFTNFEASRLSFHVQVPKNTSSQEYT